MKNAYICTLLLKHPNGVQSVTSLFFVADSPEAAVQRAREQLNEAEFISDTRGTVIESHSVHEIGREHIEEAATEVLDWKPPA